jgi:hypothetical protein
MRCFNLMMMCVLNVQKGPHMVSGLLTGVSVLIISECTRVTRPAAVHGRDCNPCSAACSQLDGLDVRSVGNSHALKETALIEAFNLKAAIELMAQNTPAAAEALAEMPPR